jgi:hypothetical protein
MHDHQRRLVLAVAEHRMSFEDIADWTKERLTKAKSASWVVIPAKKVR